MDRVTDYFGQIPLETDLLKAQQFAMTALAKLSAGVLGPVTAVNAFECTPTTPASLNVILTPGEIYQLEDLEASVWSSLPADLAHEILKQGILLDPVTLGITPPNTVGYSQVYLLEVQYQDNDTDETTLPYFNANNPSVNFAGPGNSGSAQNTVRQGKVAFQLKAGVAAASGTQLTPAADAGWTGLFAITVANGATTITSGNITQLPLAPFIPTTLMEIPSSVQDNEWVIAQDTGAVNAIVASINPAPAAYVLGLEVKVKIANTNTGATTINLNGLGAVAVRRANAAALSAGDITAGMVATLIYDGTGFQVENFTGFTASTTNNNTFSLTIPYAADSGAANAIVASFTPAITAPTAGELVVVKLANTVTGPTTITVNALAAVAVVNQYGQPLQANDLVAGQMLTLEYTGSVWQVNVARNSGGVAGSASRLAGSAAGGTKTASWTVSELIAKTALGGIAYIGASLALNFNGATTGAGGMDTGSMPTSADLNIYAIYNPTTQTWATLGTTACNGEVYTGANMPAGYTASALICSCKADSSSNIIRFTQVGRRVTIANSVSALVDTTPLATVGVTTAWTALSLASLAPANARTAWGAMTTAPANSGSSIGIASTANGDGWQGWVGAQGVNADGEWGETECPNCTVYYQTNSNGGGSIYVGGYTF